MSAPSLYAEAAIERITAGNGIEYAYRDLGDGDVPLILLQHFRGNLDNWDPALVDALAAQRRVIAFDNVGVGGTTGATPSTVEAMAYGAIAFLDALRDYERVDLLGFSLGSFVAQELALIRPDLLRRVVLASAAPQGAAGMHGWAPQVIGAVGARQPTQEGYVSVFFARARHKSRSGATCRGTNLRAGQPNGTNRRHGRPARPSTTPCAPGASPTTRCSSGSRAIELPVFVANGDSDPMILPRYSLPVGGAAPERAPDRSIPDSAHGFLFQHHSRVRGRRERVSR